MIRALVIKELRECLPLVAVAAGLAAWALHVATGGRVVPGGEQLVYEPDPFLYGDGITMAGLPFIAGGLAVLLGLKQTVWEDFRGSYFYLLHRPISRSRVFLVKPRSASCLLSSSPLIVVYAAWAATPGTHASPFFWSMTLPAWQTWFVLPVVYLGALVSGIRPARWYGSRLLPLLTCVAVAVLLGVQPWFWVTFVGVAATCAVALSAAMHAAATRDY